MNMKTLPPTNLITRFKSMVGIKKLPNQDPILALHACLIKVPLSVRASPSSQQLSHKASHKNLSLANTK